MPGFEPSAVTYQLETLNNYLVSLYLRNLIYKNDESHVTKTVLKIK